MLNLLTRNTTVSFSTFNDALLNTRFENVLVVSTMDYQDAVLKTGVDAKHAAIWPYIKDRVNLVNDPKSYDYYNVQLSNGERVVVGEIWIDPDTIRTISNIKKTALLEFDNPQQQTRFEVLMKENRLNYTYQV